MTVKLDGRALELIGVVKDVDLAGIVGVSVKNIEKARRKQNLAVFPADPPEWVLAVSCRQCQAGEGDLCRAPIGMHQEVPTHVERVVDAWAKPEAPGDSAEEDAEEPELSWCEECKKEGARYQEDLGKFLHDKCRTQTDPAQVTLFAPPTTPESEEKPVVYALAELPSIEEIKRMEWYLDVECGECMAEKEEYCRQKAITPEWCAEEVKAGGRKDPCYSRLRDREREYQRNAGLLEPCPECGCNKVKGKRCEACAESDDYVETPAEYLPDPPDAAPAEDYWSGLPDTKVVETVTTPKLGLQHLSIEAIRTDGGTQARVGINAETVADYAEKIGDLPPVRVFIDHNGELWLVDGFHRLAAHKQAGKQELDAIVESGERVEAQWEALAANTKHGLRITNEDKERAVRIALKIKPEASNRQIAKQCGCTHPLVAKIRKKVEEGGEEEEGEELPWPTREKEQKAWIAECTALELLNRLLSHRSLFEKNLAEANNQVRTLHEIARADMEEVLNSWGHWTKKNDCFWPLIQQKVESLADLPASDELNINGVCTKREAEELLRHRGIGHTNLKTLLHVAWYAKALEADNDYWITNALEHKEFLPVMLVLRLEQKLRKMEEKNAIPPVKEGPPKWNVGALYDCPVEDWVVALDEHSEERANILREAFRRNVGMKPLFDAAKSKGIQFRECPDLRCRCSRLGDHGSTLNYSEGRNTCHCCWRTEEDAREEWAKALEEAKAIVKLAKKAEKEAAKVQEAA